MEADLERIIQCPVCLQVPKCIPIYRCDNGHIYCKHEYHGKISKNDSYIKGCSEKTQSLGTQYFAVKEGGGCLASKREEESLKFGRNWQSGSNCISGIGGPGEISIYYLRKFKSPLQY